MRVSKSQGVVKALIEERQLCVARIVAIDAALEVFQGQGGTGVRRKRRKSRRVSRARKRSSRARTPGKARAKRKQPVNPPETKVETTS